MLLYLVQHAEALREEEDPTRGLSEKGMGDIKKVASYASALGLRAERILHSGKKRALQTAEVLSDYLKIDNISQTDGLSPMDDPKIWFDRVSEMDEDIILVGHLPHLDRLSSLLLCDNSEKRIIDFKMGCMVCLKRFEDRNWSVEWMIVPEVL